MGSRIARSHHRPANKFTERPKPRLERDIVIWHGAGSEVKQIHVKKGLTYTFIRARLHHTHKHIVLATYRFKGYVDAKGQ